MIQIDDAGSGSLLGGTCIGIMRIETGEYHHRIIPLELYKGKNFVNKAYQDYVIPIVKDAFKELGISNHEPIQVCRGYMFDKLKRWLENNNYSWKNAKIEDPLQTIVENTFEDYAVSLGLPSDYIHYTRYPFHFHRLLKWVYADYKTRSQLCKTGWNSWRKYGCKEYEVGVGSICKSSYYCLKCGKRIPSYSKVKTIRYITNRLNTLYLHLEC